MKKLFIHLTVFLLFSSVSYASPFLAWDPTTDQRVAGSQIEINGVWAALIDVGNCTDKSPGCIWTDPEDNKQHYIGYDMASDPDGVNQYRARWLEESGREGLISAPFEYDNTRLPGPGLRVIP